MLNEIRGAFFSPPRILDPISGLNLSYPQDFSELSTRPSFRRYFLNSQPVPTLVIPKLRRSCVVKRLHDSGIMGTSNFNIEFFMHSSSLNLNSSSPLLFDGALSSVKSSIRTQLIPYSNLQNYLIFRSYSSSFIFSIYVIFQDFSTKLPIL